jgi:predicted nucleic acid-binding protein
MRFWDSSALIPLLLQEDRSSDAALLIRQDSTILTSALTPVEIASALWRRRHAGQLDAAVHDDVERAFAELTRRWRAVAVTQEIVRLALGVLSRHPLRSMDALQLAAALFVSGRTEGLEMVTFDTRLGRAARNEGLIVIM